jgi:pyruvate dehydrogenase E1 component beta subunit
MASLSMVDALNAALHDAMAEDERVLVFGEDVGRMGGVFRVTQGLTDKFGERRCFDTPLAESAIIGTSIGLAMRGYRPVPELQFDGFSYPAFEQLVSHLAKLRNRSQGLLSMPVTVRVPSFGGIGSPKHHGESIETFVAHTAGLKVVVPSTPADTYSLLRESIASDDPVVFLEQKRRYWTRAEVELPVTTPPIGQAVVRRAGDDVTIVCYGPMVETALEAADAAEGEGWSLEVIDLRSLVPFDRDTVVESVRRTGRASWRTKHLAPAAWRERSPRPCRSTRSGTCRRPCCGSPDSTRRTRPPAWNRGGTPTSIASSTTSSARSRTVTIDERHPRVPAARPR